jgi:hypothetical protein
VRRPPQLKRDTVLFISGLIGVAHQTIVAKAEKPTLLLLFGAMIGLPAFLRGDESKSKSKSKAEDEDEDE